METWRIDRHLYQGSAPLDVREPGRLGFHVLVLCALEHQPHRSHFPGVHVLHVPLDDACPTRDEWRRAVAAAREVARHVHRGERVLVTCWQGRNRSGLVIALALRWLGRSPQVAVSTVQRRHPGALVNPHFVRAILAGRCLC